MSVQTVITLLGGLAFFLFGMRVMGEGLERAADGAGLVLNEEGELLKGLHGVGSFPG